MEKYLYLSNGKWLDKNNNNNPFKGVVPRDLQLQDKFERDNKIMQVSEIDEFDDGSRGIVSTEVGVV